MASHIHARQGRPRRVPRGARPGPGAALLSWLSFAATFGAVRGITYSIKDGKGPFDNLSIGGEHLHHYMWGIGVAPRWRGGARRGALARHPAVALSYGTGLALIVDEFALLLDLKDVYWAKQGRDPGRPGHRPQPRPGHPPPPPSPSPAPRRRRKPL